MRTDPNADGSFIPKIVAKFITIITPYKIDNTSNILLLPLIKSFWVGSVIPLADPRFIDVKIIATRKNKVKTIANICAFMFNTIKIII